MSSQVLPRYTMTNKQSRKPALSQTRQFSLTSRYHGEYDDIPWLYHSMPSDFLPRKDEKMVQVPEMAESITEGTLKQFSKQIGDYVEQDEEIATIETDKIDVAVNAPEAGTIKEFLAKEEDTVTVGQDLVKLELGGAPSGGKKEQASEEPKSPASDAQETSSQPEGQQEESKTPPKQESQPEKESKPEPSKQQESKPEPPKQPEQKKESKPEPKKDGKDSKDQSKQQSAYGSREERRVKMNRMRLRIAERLKQSQNTAASLTTFNEVDMSALMQMRKQYKDEILKSRGVKLGFMGAFSRAAVLAMKDIPAVNASIEGPGGGDTIVYRDYVDISVAVATEKGLVTPVVRNTESMDMIGIEEGIAELGKKVCPKLQHLILQYSTCTNTLSTRPATTNSPSKTWRAAPSPSAMAASSAPSWAPPSSTCRRPPCSVYMPSKTSLSSSTARSKSAL